MLNIVGLGSLVILVALTMVKPTCLINWRVLISATDGYLDWESSDAPVRCCMPISSNVLKQNELRIQGSWNFFRPSTQRGIHSALGKLTTNLEYFESVWHEDKPIENHFYQWDDFCTLGTSADPLHRSRQPSHVHPAIRSSSVCQAMLWDRMTPEDTGVIWDIHECVKGDII